MKRSLPRVLTAISVGLAIASPAVAHAQNFLVFQRPTYDAAVVAASEVDSGNRLADVNCAGPSPLPKMTNMDPCAIPGR